MFFTSEVEAETSSRMFCLLIWNCSVPHWTASTCQLQRMSSKFLISIVLGKLLPVGSIFNTVMFYYFCFGLMNDYWLVLNDPGSWLFCIKKKKVTDSSLVKKFKLRTSQLCPPKAATSSVGFATWTLSCLLSEMLWWRGRAVTDT